MGGRAAAGAHLKMSTMPAPISKSISRVWTYRNRRALTCSFADCNEMGVKNIKKTIDDVLKSCWVGVAVQDGRQFHGPLPYPDESGPAPDQKCRRPSTGWTDMFSTPDKTGKRRPPSGVCLLFSSFRQNRLRDLLVSSDQVFPALVFQRYG